jgi:hypothetical protein
MKSWGSYFFKSLCDGIDIIIDKNGKRQGTLYSKKMADAQYRGKRS